ncbi:phosphodiester glycosidase family protein [Paenibacillus contaminans]|uniref:Phosphodiester glycosidase family protein n=1 Tax=Paenibacillus contaminans TaxID=450362 RepID=A0A329MT12_9BACL|nr:phosphodiester glycosidase family protein [Paenibacillus contaminans]RAV22496.1 phosphodiester glycosidase family protein [Paenibacillus contaminans]
MNPKQQVNRFFLLMTAPFLGMLMWLLYAQLSVVIPKLDSTAAAASDFSIHNEAVSVGDKLTVATAETTALKSTIEQFYELYDKSSSEANAMVKIATSQVSRPTQIFDSRLSEIFGKPTKQVNTDNIDLKLYAFSDQNYKGYALKADLKSDKAMQMILGKDKIGGSETTQSAANRYGAVAGVNAGGFADDKSGRYPTGTTVYNSKYVYGFFPSEDNYSFVGLNADRKLIGGKFYRQSELDKLKPTFGATFVPQLLKDGSKLELPSQWVSSPFRAPRTVIGNFRNDQILIIVTDGYDERGGSGSTLAELQDKMHQLGIQDAYNLDGGGSSTLVFDGKVVNRPSDGGRMRPLPTHFLFFK